MQLQFAPMFFGEAVHKNVAIFNNGPTEVRFDLSYGKAADMKALAGSDKGEEAHGGQHAAFMQMARVRVSNYIRASALIQQCNTRRLECTAPCGLE